MSAQKLKFVLCLIATSGFLAVSAQNPGGGADLFQMQRELGNIFRQVDNDRDYDNGLKVIGSPYVQRDFSEAVIVQKEVRIPGVYARYDALKGRLEMKIEKDASDEETYIVKADSGIKCIILDDEYLYKSYIFEGEESAGYVVALVSEGYYNLYLHQHAYFKEGRVSDDPLKGDVPNKFVQEEHLLLGQEGGLPEEVKMKEKHLLKVMNDDHKAMARGILREKGFSLNDAQELALFFKELNQRISIEE